MRSLARIDYVPARLVMGTSVYSLGFVGGIKTYVYDLGGGLNEFLAIGTAVKRSPTATTRSSQLPPQAIVRDRDTFFNTAEASYGVTLTNPPQ